MPLSGANRPLHLAVMFQRLGPMARQQVLLHLQVCGLQTLLNVRAPEEATQPIGTWTNLAFQRLQVFRTAHQPRRLPLVLSFVEGFLSLPGVIAIPVGQTRVTCHGYAPFVTHTLGSISGDSGCIVSSILPSTSALSVLQIPTGKMGTRPPAGRLAQSNPVRPVRDECPVRAPGFRRVLPHVRGFPTLRVRCWLRLPSRSQRAFPLTVRLRLPEELPASTRRFQPRSVSGFPRVGPHSRIPDATTSPHRSLGASHVLRRRSSCMPRPVGAGGPSPPRQHGCSRVAFGVREHPRRPRYAPLRSCTSTSGDAAPPAASRIRCRRFVPRVRRVPTTPPWTHDAIRVGGSTLPGRDSHPARDAKLAWRDNVAHDAHGSPRRRPCACYTMMRYARVKTQPPVRS
jgi:hypothetical protein